MSSSGAVVEGGRPGAAVPSSQLSKAIAVGLAQLASSERILHLLHQYV